jgi:hypothetical protein
MYYKQHEIGPSWHVHVFVCTVVHVVGYVVSCGQLPRVVDDVA